MRIEVHKALSKSKQILQTVVLSKTTQQLLAKLFFSWADITPPQTQENPTEKQTPKIS